jgi:hypothetical protein
MKMLKIVYTCPVGDCIVELIREYDRGILTEPGLIRNAKSDMRTLLATAHKSGQHDEHMKRVRND